MKVAILKIDDSCELLVCEDGQIYRMAHRTKSGRFQKTKLLSHNNKGNGYMRIQVVDQFRKRKRFFVHRLVAEAFLDNYSARLEVDHINGNKSDNRLCNLRMLTKSQNARAFRSQREGSSVFRCVYWENFTQKWRVCVAVYGKTINGGRYTCERTAAMAANALMLKHGYAVEALNNLPEVAQ